jgi:WD40 repeat protein
MFQGHSYCRLLNILHPVYIENCAQDVDALAWHPNCNYIATGSVDRSARLFDVQTGACVRLFAGHRGGVQALAVAPDGRTLATAADDGGLMLWDMGCVLQLLHNMIGLDPFGTTGLGLAA